MRDARVSRRSFLQHSATAAASVSGFVSALSGRVQDAAAQQSETKPNLVPIVDTHQHLWDLSKFDLPWQQSEELESLRRDFVMADYLKATAAVNVVKSVYMEVNVAPRQQLREARYVLDLCRRDDNPMVAAVIGGYPWSDDFRDYIEPLAKHPEIRGVRTVLHDPDRKQGLCLQPQFVRSMKLLGKLGLSFDLCMRPTEISDGVRLAERCPQTRFIIDHCGNMSVTESDKQIRETWMKGMRAAAKLENVVCKISGIVVTADADTWKPSDLAPNMDFCMETFGDDRVFFGGDWPVCTLKASFAEWVNALKWIVRERSPKFQRKLFHDNAVSFYGLESLS